MTTVMLIAGHHQGISAQSYVSLRKERRGTHLMSKPIPTIMKYMTTTPHSVGSDQPLKAAVDMMKEHGFRHLPVLHGGKLKGILSDRDLKMAMGLKGVDATVTKVDEIAIEDPYLIEPSAKLDEVVRNMANQQIGSALVVDNHKLVGIFTTTDAMKAFDELLHTRLHS
jgi:acetoin utilization protein AcuB